MLDNKENFPRDINVYLNYYSFKDKDKVYTNGIDLIPLSRVQTAVEHYIEEIKNKYKRKIVKYYYQEDMDRYLIGKYKAGSKLYYAEVNIKGELIYRYEKDHFIGRNHAIKPKELTLSEWMERWFKYQVEHMAPPKSDSV